MFDERAEEALHNAQFNHFISLEEYYSCCREEITQFWEWKFQTLISFSKTNKTNINLEKVEAAIWRTFAAEKKETEKIWLF